MATRSLKLLFSTLITLLLAQTIHAQEAPKAAETPKPASKGPTEKTLPADFIFVWNTILEVLTEKGLSEHPHGKMSASKDSGKIATPIFRYFKILSAKPVVEIDYRDNYTITVSQEAFTKDKMAKEKAEEAKSKAEEAKEKEEEAKEKTGEEAKALLEEAKVLAEEAKKAEAEIKPMVEEAKKAAAAPKATKVIIERKFEIHDDAKREWIAADPGQNKVGITEENLLRAIEAKLASSSPAAEPTKLETIVQTNLSLTPPLIQDADIKPAEPPTPAAPAPVEIKK